MPRESMTPRERWQAVLRHEIPDRVPLDYTATPEVDDRLSRHLGCADTWEVCQRLHIDRRVQLEPRDCGPSRGADCDPFGCRRALIHHAGGAYLECVSHPLAEFKEIGEVERNYAWPTADDWDYSVLTAQLKGREEYPVQGGGSEPFLTYTELRGLERAYRDLLLNRPLVEYCLDKLFDLAYERTRRIYEQLPGRVDVSYIAEDFGSQENLLFAPHLIRTIFIPRMRRMIDLAHQAGVAVFCHSDGAIRPIIPDLLDAGIDILNPIQWRCAGMNRAALQREFGGRVVFHGAMDNQHTLAFGTVDAVRQEVSDNIRLLGATGGYILAPCHNIQVISPSENIVALYEAARACGWY